MLKEKDRQLEEMKNEQRSLSLQLSDSKRIIAQLSSVQNDLNDNDKRMKIISTQMREKEARIVEL